MSETLAAMGILHTNERLTDDEMFSIDIAVEAMDGRPKVAIEVHPQGGGSALRAWAPRDCPGPGGGRDFKAHNRCEGPRRSMGGMLLPVGFSGWASLRSHPGGCRG